MSRSQILTLIILLALAASAACQAQPVEPAATSTTVSDMPNPASVHCKEHDGKVDLRTDASGAVAGFCVFPDGSECDEWAYFRGECSPGEPADPAPEAELGASGWKIYRNASPAFSFHYPAEAEIQMSADALGSLAVLGPMAGGDSWPVFYLSYPGDREDYRPPEGVDLLQWLSDHNLLGEQRLEDVQIAGTTAIHFRHARSPQSYSDDRYFFAHAGQLYQVVILHTGDKEDWALYDRFLQSIQLDE